MIYSNDKVLTDVCQGRRLENEREESLIKIKKHKSIDDVNIFQGVMGIIS